MRISQSGLKKFAECPGKFWLRYGENRQEATNYFAEVGKLVHLMIENKVNGVTDAVLPIAQPEALAEACDLFQRWEKVFEPELNPQDVLSTEEQTTIRLGKHDVEFRIDDARDIGGFLTITDNKTTHKLMTTEELKRDLQTRLYCVVALKLWPTYNEMIYRICSIRHGVYQTLELERGEVESWEESLILAMDVAEVHLEAKSKGDDNACQFTPGDCCTNCGFFDVCPAVKEIAEITKKDPIPVKKISNSGIAERVGQWLTVVERYLRDQKKVLKTWCEDKGPVVCNGVTWAVRANPSNWVDLERIPEEMLEELRPYMVLNDGKKSKIWENQALIKKLQALGAIKVQIRNEIKAKAQSDEEVTE